MESTRRLVIMLLLGVVVIFGVIAARNMFNKPQSNTPVVQESRIMIAKHDVPPGTVIQAAADLEWKAVPPENIKENELRDGSVRLEDFNNAIVRRPLRAGEPVTNESMTKAGEGGFMSAVLEPGMRAVSISVSATSGNAGFVSPGDRVDLIVAHRIHLAGVSAADGAVVSQTFVRDVRVVAVDQQLDNPDNKAILAKTITVEVTPQQAERIAVATEMGKISLALRGLANQPRIKDPEDNQVTVTRDSDVSPALASGGGMPSTIRVIRGDQTESLSLQ